MCSQGPCETRGCHFTPASPGSREPRPYCTMGGVRRTSPVACVGIVLALPLPLAVELLTERGMHGASRMATAVIIRVGVFASISVDMVHYLDTRKPGYHGTRDIDNQWQCILKIYNRYPGIIDIDAHAAHRYRCTCVFTHNSANDAALCTPCPRLSD